MSKKLTRSQKDRMVAGVLGGIASYFRIDPTIVRLIFVIGLFLSLLFPLAFIYLAAIFIIPNEGEV
ncbi:PspC domain-containing protein [Aquibacillus sp. 3ASR75-11]|uniref:PspC domain-containing protein n=1 Tax=Terrihalobacillus insolitus TaxID=2950438 RepID=A0A9X3WQV7_9BACI|nr:PspC domain-containing protein [Terrihalobacillus insolitus]MDC3412259.1 PspC domain-containing protein [Terrihalobacillus insolitus]MDC3423048.1 PspC domain-containing protein [Terrihalobacillus insolitus]